MNPNKPRYKPIIFYNKCNNYLDRFFAKFSLDIKNSPRLQYSRGISVMNGPEVPEAFEQDLEVIGRLIIFGIDHIQPFQCFPACFLAF